MERHKVCFLLALKFYISDYTFTLIICINIASSPFFVLTLTISEINSGFTPLNKKLDKLLDLNRKQRNQSW